MLLEYEFTLGSVTLISSCSPYHQFLPSISLPSASHLCVFYLA